MDRPELVEIQNAVPKSNRFRWILGALIGLLFTTAGGIYSWRYMYNPCEVDDVKEASDFLVSQLKSYDGQYQFTTTVYPN